MRRIYLDYNASTPTSQYVADIVRDLMLSSGNPHSPHLDGKMGMDVIEEAQTLFCDYLDCFEDEIIFTSGATEANNLAISGALSQYHLVYPKKNRVLYSALEHKSIIEPLIASCEQHNLILQEVQVTTGGMIDLDHLKYLMDNSVLMVALIAVNSEVGTVQPLSEVGKLCREYDSLFLVDATQAAYEVINPSELGINLMSMSAHKMYGPMGVGLLYADNSMPFRLKPLIHGGGQQNGIRAGTIPFPLVAGFSIALKEIQRERRNYISHLLHKRNLFLQALRSSIPDFLVNGDVNNRHPGNLNIQLPNIDARMLVHIVADRLSISTGSACSSGLIKPSSLLLAMGLTKTQANSSLRVSFGVPTTETEIYSAVDIISAGYFSLL